MKRYAAVLALSSALVAAPLTAAQKLIPLSDTFIGTPQSSNPRNLFRVGSSVFFSANDGSHGEELWRTDGAPSGTVLVRDLNPGAAGSYPFPVGNIGASLIFIANDQDGLSLWTSDGSPGGTIKLAILPQPQSGYGFDSYAIGVAADTRVFIMIRQNYATSVELLVTDGTVDGTREVGQFPAQLSPEPAGAKGLVYFVGQEASVGNQLWVSDGTPIGTHVVRRMAECLGQSCGPVPTGFFRMGDRIYFTTSDSLWQTDGTAAGTQPIAQLPGAHVLASSPIATYLNNFTTLWRTDGTAIGTRPGIPFGLVNSSLLQILPDGRLIAVQNGSEVWQSDGSASGTAKVATVPTFVGPTSIFGAIANRILVRGWSGATGWEPWLVDVDTHTATLLKDLDPRLTTTQPYSSSPDPGVSLDGTVIFSAANVNGRELWRSDGTSDGTTMLLNIAPDPGGGVISGTVSDNVSGTPVGGATVLLCTSATHCEDATRSDANGHYAFAAVIPGTYDVVAHSTVHVAQFYDRADCPCPPATITPVTVVSGFETTGVDFSLRRGGTISGTVTRASTGAPVSGIQVFIRTADGFVVNSPLTDSQGNYHSTALMTDDYYVATWAANSGTALVDQVYRARNCDPVACDWASGDPVHVTMPDDTSGIDFSLHGYGTISGTIRDVSGLAPVSGLFVEFTRTGSTLVSATVTSDGSGAYISPLLAPGSYYVVARGRNGYHTMAYPDVVCNSYPCELSSASAVSVTIDSATRNIDFSLTHDDARLYGTISDAAGTPLQNLSVYVRDTNGFSITAPGTTDASGHFSFFGLTSGTVYLNAAGELYDNVDCSGSPCNVAGAIPIELVAGQSVNIDMRLRSLKSIINGRLIDAPTGQVIQASSVLLFGASGAPVDATWAGRQDNTYQVTALSRERFFYVVGVAPLYHRTSYPGVAVDCGLCSFADATPIAAGTTNGVDIQMLRAPTISGIVFDLQTGHPLPNIFVQFVSQIGQVVGTTTDANGHYRSAVSQGFQYAYVSTSSGGYYGQIYRDRDCITSCDPRAGDAIFVPDGLEAYGIDFHLLLKPPTAGSISGRVVDDVSGAGVANGSVTLEGTGSTSTDADGYFKFDNVPFGRYHLWAYADGRYLISIYGAGFCTDLGTTCNVAAAPFIQVNGPTGVNDIRLISLHLSGIAPALGPTSGGMEIVVSGANFTPDSVLYIGEKRAPVASISPTRIVAFSPPAIAGSAHVTVKAGSASDTILHGFTYRATSADMTGDGRADIVWRNTLTGANYVYTMSGLQIVAEDFVNTVDPVWRLAGSGDFDGDGQTDLLWRNTVTGENYVYLMSGHLIGSNGVINIVRDPNWAVAGIGDFDGDGKADILWRNHLTGVNYIYFMNGRTISSQTPVNQVVDQAWQVAGVSDFNGDGRADILWRNHSTGENYIYLMDGGLISDSRTINVIADQNWTVAGLGDFNADGRADIFWRNTATGLNYIYFMSGLQIVQQDFVNSVPDLNWQVAAVADYNGDGVADVLWRNTTTGVDYIYLMNGSAIAADGPINVVPDQAWQILGR